MDEPFFVFSSEEIEMRIYMLILPTSASILACGAIAANAQTHCAQAPAVSIRQYPGGPLPPASSGGPIPTIRPSLGETPVPQPSTRGAPIPRPFSEGKAPTLQSRSGQACIS